MKRNRTLEHWHKIALGLMLFDALAIISSYFVALWLRFDCRFSAIPGEHLQNYASLIFVVVIATEFLFGFSHLYNSIWRFASYTELFRSVVANIVSTVFHIAIMELFVGGMPMLYYVFGAMLQLVLTVGIRFSFRLILWFRAALLQERFEAKGGRIMLIGAGQAGQMILRDIKHSPRKYGVVKCIIDDNSNKWGRFIDGVIVAGGRDAILDSAKKYKIDKIFVALPSAGAESKRDILNICQATGCELKNLPGMYQLYEGDVSVTQMKDVSVEDLLGREPIRVDNRQIFDYLSDKVVLITGAAGSIGSELSRQIAERNPRMLILFDVYENTTYELQLELKDRFPNLNLKAIIGSVRDSRKLDEVFGTYKPEAVFHAAAHKHVPLMEDSPCEAIKNNTIGTFKTAYAAMMHGCKRFVLISTDKAVNPTNIMGASKRLCEMVIQSIDRKIKDGRVEDIPNLFTHEVTSNELAKNQWKLPENARTEFVAVRFGNVLGSNGSVIPLFKRQIAKGGPVTVTHPDIIRYFMTIPEAVGLVLQAATYAHGGEIFVLDMGAAVKIDLLARNLIRLSGFRPDVDIKIQYTGLRPGEKLYEEKLMAEEGMKKTPNDLIHIGSPLDFDPDVFFNQLEKLMAASYANSANIRSLVAEVVDTYHPAGEHGSEEKGKAYEEQMKQTATV